MFETPWVQAVAEVLALAGLTLFGLIFILFFSVVTGILPMIFGIVEIVLDHDDKAGE